MPFIRFVRDYQVKAEGGASYSVGDVVECSVESARHFTDRRAAVECEKPQPKAAAKPKAPAKKDAPKDATQD